MGERRYVRPKKDKPEATEEATPKRRGRPSKPKEPIPFVSGIPEGVVKEIRLDEIDLDNTELEFRVDQKLKDLVQDIQKNGQQFPVILRKVDSGSYQLVSGFRRCRSIKALGWSSIKAIVREDLDDDQAFRISFMENEKRKNLTGVDKAHAIAKLRLRGKNDEEIQEIFGIGQKQVGRYKQVSTFPPDLKRSISNGQIQTTHGLALMKVYNHQGDKVDLKDWIGKIEHEELSTRQLTRALNAEFGKPKVQKRFMEKFKNGGFRLFPMRFDPDSSAAADRKKMLNRLEAAVELLKKAGGQ